MIVSKLRYTFISSFTLLHHEWSILHILGTSFIYLLDLPHPWVSGDGHEPQYPTCFWMKRWTKSTCKPNRNSISKTKNQKLNVERRHIYCKSPVWFPYTCSQPVSKAQRQQWWTKTLKRSGKKCHQPQNGTRNNSWKYKRQKHLFLQIILHIERVAAFDIH